MSVASAGGLPEFWVELTALTSLNASRNLLTGTLPEAWAASNGSFAQLAVLDLAHNMLKGELVSCRRQD